MYISGSSFKALADKQYADFAFVIEKLFPAYLGLSVEEAKSRWLGVILSDEACQSLLFSPDLLPN